MASDPTLFGRALDREQAALGHDPDPDADAADGDAPTDRGEALVDRPGISARSTTIGGEAVDLADPATSITFDDESGLLSGEHGQPRPRRFHHARQLGKTPQMQLIKHAITQQLTGGAVQVVGEGDLTGPMADVASMIEDIYAGPHFQRKDWDDLVTDTVSDLVDLAWAYWEMLPSADGEFPVAGFKPLPPLQIQHNVDEDTGGLVESPGYWQVPMQRRGGRVTVDGEPTPLDRNQVVAMRGPLTSESDTLYGESLATKVREWLELVTDVDVHQRRHYADSQLPAGFLHFTGALDDDDLQDIEQDIVEVSGDPHELVTTSTDGDASWIPVGESVVDLDAISEQKWYFKLVLAAAGLNANEVGLMVGEDAGFAKESPAQARQTFKKITKPYTEAIMGPQNTQALPEIRGGFSVEIDDDLRIELERFDPLHEQIERDEMLEEWAQGVVSLAELRGQEGRETEPMPVELSGVEVDIASTPKYVVETLVQAEQTVDPFGDGGGGGGSPPGGDGDEGAASIGEDPVVSLREAGRRLGVENPQQAASRLADETRQLEESIQIQSSFLVSTAYDRVAPLMQLEFEKDPLNAVYWYADVAESLWFRFLQASSKGRFFNSNIRGEYQYARVQ